MRSKMREKTMARKENMFQPVVGELVVKEVTSMREGGEVREKADGK